MALMDWNDRLSVGVKMIDDDHQALVRLVNELHDAVSAARGNAALGKVLDGLISYTKTHFGREEAEMAKFNYPGAADHKKQHLALATKVLEVQAQFKAGNHGVLSMQVLAFLRDWLLDHIGKTDMALGVFLKSKGQRRVG